MTERKSLTWSKEMFIAGTLSDPDYQNFPNYLNDLTLLLVRLHVFLVLVSRKLGSQKLLAQAHFWCASKISFSPVFTTPMGIFGQKYPAVPHLLHPKNDQKRTHIGQKWQKEWCYHTFVKEWMKALDKTRILAPSDYFYHFSFSRYGRLKSKFLSERYSHCIYSSCSLELTKTGYTWRFL